MTEQELVDMVADANDHTTPSERLNAIYEAVVSSDVPSEHCDMLLLALARNPNTPPNHIEWLAIGHPEEVLKNPALALLILEDPAFPHGQVPVDRLAGVPGCPESIRRRARQYPGVILTCTNFSADGYSVDYRIGEQP